MKKIGLTWRPSAAGGAEQTLSDTRVITEYEAVASAARLRKRGAASDGARRLRKRRGELLWASEARVAARQPSRPSAASARARSAQIFCIHSF
jgi:hypothetical protein